MKRTLYSIALAAVLATPAAAQIHRPSAPAGQATAPRAARQPQRLPGLGDIISEQPEGELTKDAEHYFEGFYVAPDDQLIYDYLGDGYAADLVRAQDGTIYIKNPFGFFNEERDVWLKATLADDGGYEVRLPQAVYDNAGGEDPVLYAWRYVKTGAEDVARKDASSQTVRFELRGDTLLKVDDPRAFVGLGAADGFFYGYGDTVSVYRKVTEAAPAPRHPERAVEYRLDFYNAYNQADQRTVSVCVEDGTVYFGGLDDAEPSLWFSGRIDGSLVRLDRWQYMGVDRHNAVYGQGQPSHMYLYPFGWGAFTDDEGNAMYGLYDIDEPALSYDAATGRMANDEFHLGINRGRHYFPFVYYARPQFSPTGETRVGGVGERVGASTEAWYDLQGRRVERPARGLYVKKTVRADGRVETATAVAR